MVEPLRTAISNFYDTLTASGFPNSTRQKLHFSAVPVVDAAGAQLRPADGYVLYSLQSAGEEQGFESDIEIYRLTFTAYMTKSNADCESETIINAIRFNSQTPSSAAGFENRATLPGFTDGSLIGIFPEGP